MTNLPSSEVVTISDIRQAIRESGLSGTVLMVHSSLRSFGQVEGGAATVIRGLLEEGCTVLVPTFTSTFEVPPPADLQPPRNGTGYDPAIWAGRDSGRIYTTHSRELHRESMGAIPATVLEMEGHVRGNHPLNPFAAVGPLAEGIIGTQTPNDVYAPLRALVEREGWVVLMGVDLTRMTLIHLAEAEAGRTLFRRWARGADGRTMMVPVGSSSHGFGSFDPVLAPVERRRTVGGSLWRMFPAREVVRLASAAIRANPRITHCGREDCLRCNDAVAGGPILDSQW
jgi:aminoglycoside 3-N-acetyltransferase